MLADGNRANEPWEQMRAIITQLETTCDHYYHIFIKVERCPFKAVEKKLRMIQTYYITYTCFTYTIHLFAIFIIKNLAR